ncbi:MAG: 30S ribosome-binding factor RbfA [Saprospiraceae bacterium]|nr:30S ribosome-binding factor RbfA [Saprospiraceae bacterium]
METIRQKQVAEMVKRNFSMVLQEEGGYIYGTSVLVSVTGVKMSPDLNIAKIYLSVYNTEDKQTVILEMEDQLVRLRQSLANRIKKHVRRVPEIALYLDDTIDEMYRVNDLFNRLHNEGAMGTEEEE